jgi:hypothetical protein
MKSLRLLLPMLAFSAGAFAAPPAGPDVGAPYTLDPGPHAGNWEGTLTGSGLSTHEFDNNGFGMTGSIGYYYTKNILFTMKQGLQLSDTQNSNTRLGGRTVVQGAYQWDFARFQPYIGLNVGGIYGADIEDDAVVGPEVGLKYFVNESTFLFGNVGYEMRIGHCCTDGIVPYSVGVGFDF